MSRWIPVDERLPELHREQYVPHPYLSQATFNDYYLMSEPVLVSREYEDADWRIVVAQYEDDLDGRTYWETMDAEILTGVNAWMPLPEPYTADTPLTDIDTEEFVEGMKNLKMEVKQTDCAWK